MNKNPIMRSILYTLSALLLLTGCTKELTEPGNRNNGKIRMNFVVPTIMEEQSGTRALLETNTTVRIVAFLADGTTYVDEQTYYMSSDGKLKPCTVKSDGSFNTVDTENELALNPDQYDFYAITPALPLNEDKKTVTVSNGVDYASSVTSNITVVSDQTLELTQLSHKSAKIALEIKKANDNTTMTALKMNPSGIGVTISVLPASQNITLNADIPAATGATTLTIPASAFTLNGTTSTATTYLLPRLGTNRMSLSYDLTYTVSGTEESKTVSGSMGNTVLEKGKSYTFTLTMRKTGATLTVIDWIESNQEVVTGQSLDYTDNGKGWFLIAAGDAKNPDSNAADLTKMNGYIAMGIYHETDNPKLLKGCPDGWRVPTLQELIMMWVYTVGSSGFPKISSSTIYWTSTEFNTNASSWVLDLHNGLVTTNGNTSLNSMRCVRDVSMLDVQYPYVDKNTNNEARVIVSREANGGVNIDKIHPNWSGATPAHKVDDKFCNLVPAKLEIAKADCNSENANGVLQTNNKYTWANAVLACNVYSESDASTGLWRLPTQRELQLIMGMYIQKGIAGITPFLASTSYWSVTENSNSDEAWRVGSNAYSVNHVKTFTTHVRCVRDVQ